MVNGKKTLAVVVDDPEMPAAMASLLSAAGYCPETFDSAETFLTCVSTCKATCLVVDIELGDISGIELAHQLAADSFSYPIIFITGLDDEVIQSQAASAGAVAFLRKPIPAKLLFEAIQKTACWHYSGIARKRRGGLSVVGQCVRGYRLASVAESGPLFFVCLGYVRL